MNLEGINSSYSKNNIGQTLYDLVIKLRPKKIVEFGILNGYSTIHMGLALKKLKSGSLLGYDLWDQYPYNHSTLENTMKNIKKYNLENIVTLKQIDFFSWLSKPDSFDILHLDISNDGDIIEKTYKALYSFIINGSKILFEGGSIERDNISWMKKFNKKPINSIKNIVNYKIVNSDFPSLSIIEE